jgi:hypothetical protein
MLSGLLRNVSWHFLNDVSGQHIDPIFKGQNPRRKLVTIVHPSLYKPRTTVTGFVLGLLTLEDVTDMLSRNVANELTLHAA